MSSAPTPDAHAYPLLIKQLLLMPLAVSPEQEIVYGDQLRFDYRTLQARIGQLAGLLTSLGVGHGDTVAVMDWDSNRYLEAYFAVPMIGAVLMMVNVRLAPEQIAYTLNHSGARVILANREFLPLLDAIDEQLPDLRTRILLDDAGGPPPPGFATEYEAGCAVPRRSSAFRTSTRMPVPRCSTPPEPPDCPRGSISATGSWCCIRWRRWPRSAARPARAACIVTMSTCPSPRCSMCTRGACPTWLPRWASGRSIRGATCLRNCWR